MDVLASAFEIKFDEEKAQDINIREVGYGAGQVLPIVLETLFSPENALVIVEQPEIHLHPQAQIELVNLLIKQAQGERRFLIETHSEHILLRIQRSIAETTLYRLLPVEETSSSREMSDLGEKQETYDISEKQFGLIFITRQKDAGRSSVEYIEIDHRGQLEAPSKNFKDFFKYDYDEIKHITLATTKIVVLENKNESGN
jgi:predicted ATPase